MKYTKNKTPTVGSSAAAEVKALLGRQEPPMGNNDAANLIGVTYETMRAITTDSRIPSVGIIYGLGRALKLTDEEVASLIALRNNDVNQRKIAQATGKASKNQGLSTLISVLTPQQLDALTQTALRMAKSNRNK